MTAKELLQKRAATVSEEEAQRALLALDAEPATSVEEGWGEPEMVGLPESWKTLPSGAPAPNWVAGLDEVRRGH